jgi:outer membrane protein assembly factor BamE (lipoprotein component of BamABCDE complex)
MVIMGRAITLAIAIAASVVGALAGPQLNSNPALEPANAPELENGGQGRVERINMRVSQLHAGADAAEVARVLGRPTTSTLPGGSEGTNLALRYAEEPVQTHVTLTGGRVTAIALDLLYIDIPSLPASARMLKPTMARGAVLALLGRPKTDETWMASDLKIEQMIYAQASEPNFSVFLSDGLVIDVRAGAAKPPHIEHIVLPAAVPDALIGPGLSIGLNPKQAAVFLGRLIWEPITSALKGQPTLYATYQERDGPRYASLTFTGGTLTAFSIWSPDSALNLGEASGFGDR